MTMNREMNRDLEAYTVKPLRRRGRLIVARKTCCLVHIHDCQGAAAHYCEEEVKRVSWAQQSLGERGFAKLALGDMTVFLFYG